MYFVDPSVWVRCSTMQFKGAAGRWLQSVEHLLKDLNWSGFCALIHERFSRDQHELILRQLCNIRQTSTVVEYVDQFSELVDQLKAYNPNPDKLYLVTRFVDGLRDDIRSVILVQRPPTLDAACTLALLQEEAGDQGKRRDFKKPEGAVAAKFVRGALPYQAPLQRPQANAPTVDDKKQAARGVTVDAKLAALRSFRKAQGLYIRCAEKWAPGHWCAPAIQLHALQAVWNLCQDEFSEIEEEPVLEPTVDEQDAQVCMLLSAAAVSGAAAPRTMQFMGSLAGREVLVLVDSGSSHSFLSTSFAQDLVGCSLLSKPVSLKVADGSTIICSSELSSAEWSVQGCVFTSTLKILPLGHFDIIVGMDWLERFSPMKVHWGNKWMTIPY